MTRYTYPLEPRPGFLLTLGWDPPNETFFAHLAPADGADPEWSVGDFHREILTTEALFTHIKRHIPQFQEGNYAERLEKDREEFPMVKRSSAMEDFNNWLIEHSAWHYPYCRWCGLLNEDCETGGKHVFTS